MTADLSRSMALSRITLASLEDMNFTVNYNAADSYTTEDLNPECVCEDRRLRRRSHVSESGRRHKEMSKRGLQAASLIGQEYLGKLSMEQPTGDYVGGKAVFVLYEDGGEVYNVLVTP
jgi:hypothetical protein